MINHKGTQNIRTGRLLLRKILPGDEEAVFGWTGDPEVCRYERWQRHESVGYTAGYVREVVREYKSDQSYHWGIQLGDELIGAIRLMNVSDVDQKATMKLDLRRDCWSKGYATEAVRAVLHYVLLEVGLNRIESFHSVNDPAAGRVLEKAGMILEGRAREHYFSNSGFQDSNLYAVTRSTYKGAGNGY
jgi:ribosomal-protein-alanine N-acetyltransferase